jgi:hypothetical protein
MVVLLCGSEGRGLSLVLSHGARLTPNEEAYRSFAAIARSCSVEPRVSNDRDQFLVVLSVTAGKSTWLHVFTAAMPVCDASVAADDAV